MRQVNVEECWYWAHGITSDGYGWIYYVGDGSKYGGYAEGAHRALYREWVGEIPKGYEVDHLCKTRCCINPDHLEAVTKKINAQRRYGVGLCKRGHKLVKGNLYYAIKDKKTGRVGRHCRTCNLMTANRAHARRRRLEQERLK